MFCIPRWLIKAVERFSDPHFWCDKEVDGRVRDAFIDGMFHPSSIAAFTYIDTHYLAAKRLITTPVPACKVKKQGHTLDRWVVSPGRTC